MAAEFTSMTPMATCWRSSPGPMAAAAPGRRGRIPWSRAPSNPDDPGPRPEAAACAVCAVAAGSAMGLPAEERLAEATAQIGAVARRQHHGRRLGRDLHGGEERSGRRED